MPRLGSTVSEATKRSGCSVSARRVASGVALRLTTATATPNRSISESVTATGSAKASASCSGTSWNMYSAGMAKDSFDSRSRRSCRRIVA